MANELPYIDHTTPGQTVYYAVLAGGASVVNASTGALQALSSGNWQSAAIAMSDSGHAGHYLASVPTNTPAGRYVWKVYQSSGVPSSTAAIGDTDVSGSDVLNWSGSAEVVLATVATSASTAATQATTAATQSTNAATSAATAATNTTQLPNLISGTGGSAAFTAPALANTPTSSGAIGPGANPVTITIKDDDGNPVIDAAVWITNDAEGQDVEAGTLRTDSEGDATFLLTAGSTYYLWMRAERINSILGEPFTAVAD